MTALSTMARPMRGAMVRSGVGLGSRYLSGHPDPEPLVESRRLWMPAHRDIALSIVMPAYNPGAALRPTVTRLVQVMRSAGVGFELIVVDDGSTDDSLATITDAGAEVRVVHLPANRGKGAALRAGFTRARGSWVGFVDADGDIDPAHLVQYLHAGRSAGADIVYADKKHRRSTFNASPVRKLMSRSFSAMIAALFTLDVHDTQTGCKLVRREVLADLLPRLRENRFAFDLELFVAASAAGYDVTLAAPVSLHTRRAGSTITRRSTVRTFTDALTVLARRHRTTTYRYAEPPRAGVYVRNSMA